MNGHVFKQMPLLSAIDRETKCMFALFIFTLLLVFFVCSSWLHGYDACGPVCVLGGGGSFLDGICEHNRFKRAI